MKFAPITKADYGALDPKVNLLPDFFTGFEPAHRAEIVAKEAAFYHGITAPYSVDSQLDKHYEAFVSCDGAKIPIKVYLPKQTEAAKVPALVFIHGGGYMTCSVETHDFVPSYLAAKANIAAFSVEYRLAPEYKHPVGLEDCYSAIKWVAENANRFGVDPARISVGGDSSGGAYSAALALMARDRGEFKLDKQVLIYPVTDLAGAVKKHSAEVYAPVGAGDDSKKAVSIADVLLAPGTDPKDSLVSPLLADDLRDLPKALFIEAECDALLDDGLMYAKRLQDAGNQVEYHIYKGMPHAFILRTYAETFEALNVISEFLG